MGQRRRGAIDRDRARACRRRPARLHPAGRQGGTAGGRSTQRDDSRPLRPRRGHHRLRRAGVRPHRTTHRPRAAGRRPRAVPAGHAHPDKWHPSDRAVQPVVTRKAARPRHRSTAGATPWRIPGPTRDRRVRPAHRLAATPGPRTAGGAGRAPGGPHCRRRPARGCRRRPGPGPGGNLRPRSARGPGVRHARRWRRAHPPWPSSWQAAPVAAQDPSPPALAAAIAALLAVPKEQRRKAARARAEMFPWSRTTDTMLALHGLTAPDSGHHRAQPPAQW